MNEIIIIDMSISTKNFIVVSGLIGAGKSHLVDKLSKFMNCPDYQEPVKDNKYLDMFYADMDKYAFNMQIYLLSQRFSQNRDIKSANCTCVQDRSIYEDTIFAKILNDMGIMSDLDYETYLDVFKNYEEFLEKPDIIIYLDVSIDNIVKRINQRSRECEKDIPVSYLEALKDNYEEWVSKMSKKTRVIRIDWNCFQSVEYVYEQIKTYL